MKTSFNWLKDYVDIDVSPEKLAEDLSLFGQEVDSVEKVDDDYMMDLEITPNRGDCLSVLGIARELAALYNKELRTKKYEVKKEKLDKKVEIKIADPLLIPRFTARIIDNIKIGESPKWMQERLATYGFRPVNNIVDITNYVMVATGQPLHAFDYDKIQDGLMNIRAAKQGEEVITLDGKNRVLNDGTIIIEDNEKIYDLAGIMGGIKSEVEEKTKTIVLQGAIFDPVLIRKTSKYLNHTTDASYRYERGVDYGGTIAGVDMAASLIKEVCPETKVGELIDIQSQKYDATKITVDMGRVNKLLGTDVSSLNAEQYVERLGFKINDNIITIPSYRAYDVKIWQDVAEEIARIYGYNIIAKSPITKTSSPKENPEFNKREYIKDILKNLGFTEIYSYSFAEKDKIELLGYSISDCVEIANPLSPETQYLRPSILPSLLSTIAKNPWAPAVNIFEIEKVFTSNKERWQLGVAITGQDDNLLKQVSEELKLKKTIENVEQKTLDVYKIRKPVKYVLIDIAEIDLQAKPLSKEIASTKYHEISRFAPTVMDLAFIVSADVKINEVEDFILGLDSHILLAENFDDFTFETGLRNIAFHIWLQDLKEAMADDKANNIMEDIINKVCTKYKAKLRGKE